ncbi:MAG: DNA primase [Alcanivoracaceae bacterium]
MARIPDNFVQDLLARTDVVELINARVPLKKAGRNYMACCPFHQEKSPSFTVAPDKQFYYCFGCGASGNAVGFLMEYERLSFPEAVKQLADRAGVEVPREQDNHPQQSAAQKSALQQMYDLLARAELFFRQQLKSAPERKVAVDYLKGRGLSGEVAARYGLGFAPPGFDNLMTALSLDQTGLQRAEEVGLLVRREDTGRVYDKFRDRIIFPIRDSRGRTIGFGGRVLGDGKPKYLNSPETPVFHKGRELYGLWEWKQSRDKHNQLFVVEGYMDVIALAQHGIANAVATLGTATSGEHAEKLFRQVDEVVFCFDGDDAGRRAAWRALENTLPVLEDGKQARFLFLPDGEDPDTLVRQQGREALLAMAAEAPGLAEYLFSHLSEGLNLGSVDGRARLARLALPLIRLPKGDFYRSLLRKELASLTRLDESDLAELASHPEPSSAANPPATTPDWQHEEGPPPWLDQHEERPSPATRRRATPRPAPERRMRMSLVERLLLILIQHPGVLRACPLPAGVEELEAPQMDVLVQVIDLLTEQPDLPGPALLGGLMAMDQGELIAEVIRQSEQVPAGEEAAVNDWRGGVTELEIRWLERCLDQVRHQPAPDIHQLAGLTRQLADARQRQRRRLD